MGEIEKLETSWKWLFHVCLLIGLHLLREIVYTRAKVVYSKGMWWPRSWWKQKSEIVTNPQLINNLEGSNGAWMVKIVPFQNPEFLTWKSALKSKRIILKIVQLIQFSQWKIDRVRARTEKLVTSSSRKNFTSDQIKERKRRRLSCAQNPKWLKIQIIEK